MLNINAALLNGCWYDVRFVLRIYEWWWAHSRYSCSKWSWTWWFEIHLFFRFGNLLLMQQASISWLPLLGIGEELWVMRTIKRILYADLLAFALTICWPGVVLKIFLGGREFWNGFGLIFLCYVLVGFHWVFSSLLHRQLWERFTPSFGLILLAFWLLLEGKIWSMFGLQTIIKPKLFWSASDNFRPFRAPIWTVAWTCGLEYLAYVFEGFTII